jgi:hypothetical protein
MFLLKSLGNIVFGKGDGTLVQLPNGSFYYLNPIENESRQLIYKECTASIKRTSMAFNYELVISQVLEEGEENFEEENVMKDSEASFLIDRCLLGIYS